MKILICNRTLPACLCLCFFLSAAMADQIALKNGDRLTGSVIKKDGNALTIKTDQVGIVTVPWDQVASFAIEKPIHIVLKNGKELQGVVSGTEAKAEATVANEKMAVETADITALRNDDEEKAYRRLLHPGWGQLWTGAGTVGFAGTSGNAKTLTFTAGIKADRITKTDKTSLHFSFIKASASIDNTSKDTAEAVRGGISYSHNISSRFFLSGFNDYEYDRFQNLDLRFVAGGAFGVHVVNTDRHRLDVLGGASYNRSKFSTPLIRESAELYWGNDYSLKISSASSLVQSYRMFNDLTNSGVYRVNFDIGVNTKLLQWLSWNISLSDRYLSDPAPGRKTNDFLYTTGLGITFAR